jgi:two-component system, OmpR family, sensor histidine kinase TctE
MPVDARPLALRTRLLAAMLGPLLGVALLLGLIGAALVTDTVRRSNDRVLGGALGAIAETVQVERGAVTIDLPAAAFGMLENSERDSIFYRVAVGGRLLTGYADLPPADPATLAIDVPRFRFARYRGREIRIAEVRRALPQAPGAVVVQIAETLDYRRAVRRRLLMALAIGELALVGVAMLLIRPALGWSLRPLARLRRAVTARDTRAAPDLSPIDAGPLPTELAPLSEAFNNLLARLDTATAGVRRFTADASHQMRTPLSALKVQLALARRGEPGALDEIAASANRLEHLMTQLLALARADEAGASPALERIALREVAATVIGRHIGRAIEAGVEVNLDAPGGEVVVQGHRTLAFEIVSNLLDNAIRYNRRGGLVVVSVRMCGDAGQIAVADDGPGLSEAEIERLGQRFVRLPSSGGQEGSGLGFAIVRSAAQRIGADIVVESTGPGLRVTVAFGPGRR